MENRNITVRAARESDIPRLGELLCEICSLHAAGRPDLFRDGGRKYSDLELKEILSDPSRPVFVASDDGRDVLGYVFCIIKDTPGTGALRECRTLYIDDLCVDPAMRGQGTGRKLFEFCKGYAAELGCHNITLNVWAFNSSAIEFYEKTGMKVQSIHMEMVLQEKGEE